MITMLLTAALLIVGIPGKKIRERERGLLSVYLVLSAVGFSMAIAYWLGYFPKMADKIVFALRGFHQFYEDGDK